MKSIVEKLNTVNMISIVASLGSGLRHATLLAKQFGLHENGLI
jgi:hypothetical protein